MRIHLTLFVSILIFSSFCYAGQYYKFVDENGVVSFTDDISKIPKEQRSQIEVKKAIKSNQQDNQSKPQDINTTYKKDDQIDDSEQTKAQQLDNEAIELNRIKAELDKEAEEINNESIKLIQENKDLKDNKSIKEYNIKI
ncbi:MAG: DUF4124 domain-containing protein, partial [Desulfamplus sp.]|nr:DUF4124 domain-containing protein [Desulfamplus sp.]